MGLYARPAGIKCPVVVLEKSTCWEIDRSGTLGRADGGFGKSLRTRDLVDDWKVTPSITTSRVDEAWGGWGGLVGGRRYFVAGF